MAGERVEGAAGRNSKLFKDFENKQLILDSVYFGNSRKSDEVAVFYNRREERKDRAESSWAPRSRVEVRIYPRTEETEKVAISILESYLDETNGWRARIPHFGEVLCRCVMFTTKRRPASPLDLKDVAPWWQLLLRTLMVGSKDFEFPNEKGLLESNTTQRGVTGFLPTIEMPKKGRGRLKSSKDKNTRKSGSGRKKNF
ncbi:putative_reverse transcriptase and intronmaturase (mitochondrion) [Klebsormidium nitens]|uniref:Putative_reverse transcriptase and intronmaturase n=1 Tax=Klebsormidium nitens TaxID=105231 RepID=A0A0U9HL59_KLENI|nr:putative_reverse transcriptase and intronmaturase [Klebsormidium nitens]|eukprot:GAQ93827.1 putative_reverse transcriptase and intronmaturase (mitochondrion) [Klebsormidium nitens]